MKIQKFLGLLILFILISSLSSSVFAANTNDVTMKIVENNICKIDLNESAYFEKKMVSYDLDNRQVTIQLKVCNDAKIIIPEGELILVIDSSESMNEKVSGNTTRRDLIVNSANNLITNLLKANNSTLKIGVVTFSSSSDPTKYGTMSDAQKVCDLTNNLSTLKTKINGITGTGSFTDLDSGLQLAKSSFTSEKNNKYLIILSDGLPNLAVGNNNLVSYDAMTDIIDKTKTTLKSFSKMNVISMLTGIPNKDSRFRQNGDKIYTYGQVTQEIFGTESNPTVGKFYIINDNEIEKTITKNILDDLLPISSSLENIVVKDYFPQYIVDNFDMAYVDGFDTKNISSKINTKDNSITWNIANLPAGETAIIQYTLTLKNEFDEKIINKVLDTNKKIDITYNDTSDPEPKKKVSDITPKIKLIQPTPDPKDEPEDKPKNEPKDEPKTEPKDEPKNEPTKDTTPKTEVLKSDNTISQKPLPKTGSIIITSAFIVTLCMTTFFGIKYKRLK